MNRKLVRISAMILIAMQLLAGCRAGNPLGGISQPAATLQASVTPADPTSTATPRPTKTPRPTATPTQDAAQARAEQAGAAVQAYFAALEAQHFEEAASLVYEFSLMVFNMTRGDAVSALYQQRASGAAWSGLEIAAVTPFDQNTMLVSVKYSTAPAAQTDTATMPTATASAKATPTSESLPAHENREEVWPMRFENGAWRYNWNNLIDFRTLEVEAQTLNGITVKPIQANRFTDRIQLVMLVQNRNNAPVVFGQANEILGTFYFAGKAIEAEKTQIVLNPLRSVPNFTLEVKGSFNDYPDSIELRRWKNYNVEPWFTFQLK